MVKVAINTSILSGPSQYRGMGLYTRKLIEALKKENKIDLVEVEREKFPAEIDLVHYPAFAPYFLTLPLLLKKKFIVTIHDLTPLVFPQAYPPGVKGRIIFEAQKRLLRIASRIITDSQNSKQDIVKYLKYPEDKIDVIYLAAANQVKIITDKTKLNNLTKKYNLPHEFILYVGDVNYNKNLLGLVNACRLAKTSLVIVGKQAVEKDFDVDNIENQPLIELNKITRGSRDVFKLGFVDEEDLSGLYSLASVYCQPSFYEGFGLSILEAMACGCPVVTSNLSSLPEVAGEAALQINPYRVDEISQSIKKILNEEAIRNRLIKLGYQQAKKFNWSTTAKKTTESYFKAINEK